MTRTELLRDLLRNPRGLAARNWEFARRTWEGLSELDDWELRAYVKRHFHSTLDRAGLRWEEFVALELMRLRRKLDALKVGDGDE